MDSILLPEKPKLAFLKAVFASSGSGIEVNSRRQRTVLKETGDRHLTPAYLPCTFAISIGVMESILLSRDIASAFAVSIEVMQ